MAPTLQEYYNTGDDSFDSISQTTWIAQTFTVGAAHSITSVKLKLFRSASPENIIVSIRLTDVNGHPTGGDLTQGIYNASGITTDTAGAWYEIPVTAYPLATGTKYAICLRRQLNGSAYLRWRLDSTSPAYGGGNFERSTNSGVTWVKDTDYWTALDNMFEIWGIPAATTYTVTYGIDATLQKLGLTRTFGADTILKALDLLGAYGVDGIIVNRETSGHAIDIIIAALSTRSRDANIDALLRELSIPELYALDVMLKIHDLQSLYHTDLVLRLQKNMSHAIDAVISSLPHVPAHFGIGMYLINPQKFDLAVSFEQFQVTPSFESFEAVSSFETLEVTPYFQEV